ncbi:MAG: neuraminidase-like domain-containing protein [Byssovorax sp.]
MNTYRLTGRIIEKGTQKGVANLRVEAWDHEAQNTDLLAVAVTTTDGAFLLTLDDDYLAELLDDRRPTITLRLFQGTQQLLTTEYRWKINTDTTPVRLEVDLTDTSGTATPSTSVVHGLLRTPSGTPIASKTVRAFDYNLTSEDTLGETTTDSAGRYRIAYATGALTRTGKIHPDLIVRAYSTEDDVIAESPRRCHAPPTARADLTAGGEYRGPSEFEIMDARLAPVLDSFDLATATEDQAAYIACSAQVDSSHLRARIDAAALHGTTDVEHAILYALLRAGLPSERPALLRTSPAALRSALEVAIDRNIIPADTVIDDAMASLRQATVAMAFDTPAAGATGNLGDLLALALSTQPVREEFLDKYLAHAGTIDDFWTWLPSQTSFAASGTVDNIQFALQLGMLSRFHFPLINELWARKTATTITSLKDLAAYSESDWIGVIETALGGGIIGYPADTPGANATEKKATYARVLKRSMELAFPSASMAADIARDGGAGSADLGTFLANNEGFEIGKTRLGAYLNTHPDALSGLSDAEATKMSLSRIERLFKIVPRYAEAKQLIDDGFVSAEVIRGFGRPAFVAKYETLLGGSEAAGLAFDRAEAVSNQALALHAKYAPAHNPKSAAVLPDLASLAGGATPKTADWSSLFGSPDACACQHCRSVLGPAAYFVDLLEFLGKYESTLTKEGTSKWSAQDVLLGRVTGATPSFPGRPDLGAIVLSCDDTDIQVPYVDLVNEILEHSVAAQRLSPAPAFPATIATTGTAEELAALPEIVSGEEAAHAAAYEELASAVHPFSLPFHFWAKEARAYLNHLGVPRHTLMQALQNSAGFPDPADIAAEHLGLSRIERRVITGSWPSVDPYTINDYWGLSGGQSTADLTGVSLFMSRSGLSFDDVVEFFDTAFIRRFGTNPALVPNEGSDGCDPDHMTISGLASETLSSAWQTIHRFLRLQRRTGYSIREMDALVTATATTIDDTFLETLAAVERFRAAGVPAMVLASWFGDLDTRKRDGGKTPSFYEQVYQNRAVRNPPDPVFDLDGGLAELIADHSATIRGALHISADDLALLTDSNVSQAAVGVASEINDSAPPTVSLSNLSKLHRIVTFARALGLSIRDFLILKSLGNISTPFTPEGIERFADITVRVRQIGIKPADLLYLFGDRPTAAATLVLGDSLIDTTLDALFAGHVKLYLAGAPNEAHDDLIAQTLAAALGLETRSAVLLLQSVLTPNGSMGTPLIEVFRFTAPSPFPDSPSLDETARMNQRAAYRALHKVTTLVKKLGMTASELARFSDASGEPLLFDFDALPRSPSTPDAELFDAWLKMADLWALKPTLVGDENALLALFPATMLSIEQASATTGWPVADMSALLGTGALGVSFGGLRGTAIALLRLRDAFALLKRLGVSAATALRWIDTGAPLPSESSALPHADTVASEIVQAAKSKYAADAWIALSPPIRDTLRDAQRGAMVDYLVAKNGYDDSNDLFGRLLVDVETCSCQITSRLKQAIGSVQTFTQRALQGLIPDVPLPAEAAEEWTWRKSYRVWEANRRVFLYPESFIDPALREGKSPFFTALEGELRQRELTSETAEAAIQHYLEKLVEIDRLEIMAMVHQVEPDDEDHPALDVLHVVARTPLVPHKYFYRSRVDAAYWTPWESIDLDIEGDHLLLAVIDRRLHLFWPMIQEKPDKKQHINEPDKGGKPAKTHLEIQLAWSERRGGAWSAKRVSTGSAVTISPVVHRYWLSFALEMHLHPPFAANYSIACLFNPVEWDPLYFKDLIRLGGFSFDACGSDLVGHDRGYSFSPTLKSYVLSNKDFSGDTIAVTRPLPSTMIYQDAKEYRSDTEITEAAMAEDLFNDDPSIDHPLKLPFVLDDTVEWHAVLGKTPGLYRVLSPHVIGSKNADLVTEADVFFYKDKTATFFAELVTEEKVVWHHGSKVQPGWRSNLDLFQSSGLSSAARDWANQAPKDSLFVTKTTSKGYRFWTFYHPYACAFLGQLNRAGAAGLLDWSAQLVPLQRRSKDAFTTPYEPDSAFAIKPYPIEDVDFSFQGAYSLYNWELFFHAPLLIASMLTQNQRFAEAQKWLHYIFDPTTGGGESAPKRFWKVRPFYENKHLASIQEELEDLAAESQSAGAQLLGSLLAFTGGSRALDDFDAQIKAWEEHPFDPHLIARMRPLAYQKAVVMKYVENLIAWGDQLFRRDTIESINEATQLYILAADILGPRPRTVRRPGQEAEAKTYQELVSLGMNAFSDPLVEVESLATPRLGALHKGNLTLRRRMPPPELRTLYFCVPGDGALLGLWDMVADRLFKLRHCMNIDGVVQKLPLFEPPIDPALIVQALASGVDLESALADFDAPNPRYRFSILYGKAMELCAGVTAFGGALLSALEKKDAEGLSRLRSTQEIEMLRLARDVKERQIKEAAATLAGLERSLEVTQARLDHYQGLEFMSLLEQVALDKVVEATNVTTIAQLIGAPAAYFNLGPSLTFGGAGATGSPVTTASWGTPNVGAFMQSASQTISMTAGILHDQASSMSTIAGYHRRREEWNLQISVASKEIPQIQKQIDAAKIRLAIAERELDNHDKQIAHAKTVDAFLRDKFTSAALYDWTVTQIATVYFQSYQLAYDVAKRAEKAFRFELGLEKSKYVNFGYWDNLRQGLLAGEKLQHDLRRMEVAYLDQNARELEITKHISLALLDPAALMTLRETGSCTLALSEKLFDLDYPGHYFRRIKSVALTIPAVSGPYTGVSCTLRLGGTATRIAATLHEGYARDEENPAADERFHDWAGSAEAIVTSSALNDAGLFEPNLRDERYLPFEGLGVIGTFTIDLPKANNAFDVSAISDVVLHLRYTARSAGSENESFVNAVKASIFEGASPRVRTGRRIFSAREDFPDAWAEFMSPPPDQDDQVLSFPLDAALFPYSAGNGALTVTKATLYARWNGPARYAAAASPKLLAVTLAEPAIAGVSSPLYLDKPAVPGSSDLGMVTLSSLSLSPSTWTIHASSGDIDGLEPSLFTAPSEGSGTTKNRLNDTLQDMWLLVEYTQTVPDWV